MVIIVIAVSFTSTKLLSDAANGSHIKAVLPNLFSTTAHFLVTAHQTAHCI